MLGRADRWLVGEAHGPRAGLESDQANQSQTGFPCAYPPYSVVSSVAAVSSSMAFASSRTRWSSSIASISSVHARGPQALPPSLRAMSRAVDPNASADAPGDKARPSGSEPRSSRGATWSSTGSALWGRTLRLAELNSRRQHPVPVGSSIPGRRHSTFLRSQGAEVAGAKRGSEEGDGPRTRRWPHLRSFALRAPRRGRERQYSQIQTVAPKSGPEDVHDTSPTSSEKNTRATCTSFKCGPGLRAGRRCRMPSERRPARRKSR